MRAPESSLSEPKELSRSGPSKARYRRSGTVIRRNVRPCVMRLCAETTSPEQRSSGAPPPGGRGLRDVPLQATAISELAGRPAYCNSGSVFAAGSEGQDVSIRPWQGFLGADDELTAPRNPDAARVGHLRRQTGSRCRRRMRSTAGCKTVLIHTAMERSSLEKTRLRADTGRGPWLSAIRGGDHGNPGRDGPHRRQPASLSTPRRTGTG